MHEAAYIDTQSIFIRKIGYSVGLENTLGRFRDVVELYASTRRLSSADLLNLIFDRSKWGLKGDNTIDVLTALDIVVMRNGVVIALPNLSSAAIARRMLCDTEYQLALIYLITAAIIRSDGDIFLNALLAEFRADEFRACVGRMLEHKWAVLEAVYRSGASRVSMYRVINIENFAARSEGRSDIAQSMKGRRAPLRSQGRTDPLLSAGALERKSSSSVNISDDYVRKVLTTRKGWATSIGLATRQGALTEQGQRFLSAMAETSHGGYGFMSVWPLSEELAKRRFPARAVSLPLEDKWRFFCNVASALGHNAIGSCHDRQTRAVVVEDVRKVCAEYEVLSEGREAFRRQAPMSVVLATVAAVTFSRGEALQPVPDIIEEEHGAAEPRIIVRRSSAVGATIRIADR